MEHCESCNQITVGVAEINKELAALWPTLVLVNGRPRYPQSQGSVKRANGTLKYSLIAWMRDITARQPGAWDLVSRNGASIIPITWV